MALYIARLMLQSRNTESITAIWLDKWKKQMQRHNPPNKCSLPPTAEYLREYLQGRAYIGELPTDGIRTVKRRIYNVYYTHARGETTPMAPRTQRKNPEMRWGHIWLSISGKHLTTNIRATWYRVVHIIPTNERLHKIRLRESPLCQWCRQTDTIWHRITACKDAENIWNWTRCP